MIDHSGNISKKAKIRQGVKIGKGAVIYDNVEIKKGACIGNGAIIGEPLIGYYRQNKYKNPRTVIGSNSIIRSGSIIYAGTRTGRNFHTGHNVVIREYSKFGNFCVFGTCSQSDGYIQIGNYCRVHNNVFLAQHTTVGNYVWLSPFVVTLDSPHPPCRRYAVGPRIADYAVIGAQSLILPRVKIGKCAVVAAGSLVNRDVAGGMLAAGTPAVSVKSAVDIKCKITSGRRPYPWGIKNIKNKIY